MSIESELQRIRNKIDRRGKEHPTYEFDYRMFWNHQPDGDGVCKSCGKPSPCPDVRSVG